MAARNPFRFLGVQYVTVRRLATRQSLALPFAAKAPKKRSVPVGGVAPRIITGWVWKATFTRWVTDASRRGIARGV